MLVVTVLLLSVTVVPDISGFVALAADRIELADQVAAAKWGTGQPIDDPPREEQVLASVAERSVRLGIDPASATAVFRDQIEASKLVQRALFRRWHADPGSRPTHRPDLLTEVRPRLDRITEDMLEALKAAERARALPSCERKLTWAAFRVSARRDLDRPHRAGLHRALGSFCGAQLVSW
ncbi:chorismate mutase [Nonomuraea endophytica]|uniref:Chorismate mutase n=1 Tax=Nonomuraea endophytica TaxID=714136 RepID=A0A7W8A3X1_9ACTN|nr:chorismate mutase [Nonomuraea endophytica]MBB5079141.1 chorismate mutase [Nonomuraea endophytica]